MTDNHKVVLASKPGVSGEPRDENFSLQSCSLPHDLQNGEILVKTLYLSVDPAMRCRMNDVTGVDYVTPWQVGDTIEGFGGIGYVVQSSNPDFNEGNLVCSHFGWPWMEYFVKKPDETWNKRCRMNDVTGVDYVTPWQVGDTIEGFGGIGYVVQSSNPDFNEGNLVCSHFGWPWMEYFVKKPDETWNKIDKSAIGDNISLFLSVLSVTGLTAYLGIKEKGHIKPGSTLVVSGAAGACGSLAGQIGRLEGCGKVIGICGSEEKCKYLREELKFSGAINYKTENVQEQLASLCPEGVDVYFDNVGGSISDQVIRQMNKDSHVILCGQIAVYNMDVPYPPPIPEETQRILQDRNITRDRFLVLNYAEKFQQTLAQLSQWLIEGKLKVKETIAMGLENAGSAFVSMMKGGNIGKQLVHVGNP